MKIGKYTCVCFYEMPTQFWEKLRCNLLRGQNIFSSSLHTKCVSPQLVKYAVTMTPYDLEDYSQLARTHKAMTGLIVSLKILSHFVSSNINRYWNEYFVLRQMKTLDVFFDISIIMDSKMYQNIILSTYRYLSITLGIYTGKQFKTID